MAKEYQNHIVSTDDHQVWLHRTHISDAPKILEKGLYFGAGDLASTATLQSTDPLEAENSYQETHKKSNAVVVIKIPRKISNRHYFLGGGTRHKGYESDKDITHWDPKNRGFVLQRQHIHGYSNKDNGEYTPNPDYAVAEKLTEEHFPSELYGGLEKDVLELSEGKETPMDEMSEEEILSLPPPNPGDFTP
ncbi:hypothetical protein HN747_00715 [archaeon]|jgi:hypothetical protein|nr:hypothetical protein [archaeon]